MCDEVDIRLKAASLIEHPGELGRARENVVREYFRAICPRGFQVSTGFVFDSLGKVSRQQDLVIVRESYHPIFSVSGVNYFPVEAVAAVLEVKSTLPSKKKVEDAIACVSSVKSLRRAPEGRRTIIGHTHSDLVDEDDFRHQVFAGIIAGSSVKSVALAQIWRNWTLIRKRQVWPNCAAVLDSCAIVYGGVEGGSASDSMTARSIGIYEYGPESETTPLMDITHDLMDFLRVTPVIDYVPESYIPIRRGFQYGLLLVDENGDEVRDLNVYPLVY